MSRCLHRVGCSALLTLGILFSSGCGSRGSPAPAAEDVALATVRQTLDAWKDGKPIDELSRQPEPVTVVEPLWKPGAKLEKYEVLSGALDTPYQFRCRSELWLKDDKGKESRAKVEYVVTTAPKLTMIRSSEGW